MDNLGKIVSGAKLKAMTYTVFDTDGTVIARHLSAEAAVMTALTHGDRNFDIRREENAEGFALWMPSEREQQASLVKSEITSSATEAARARQEIFAKVIAASGSWQGPTIIDDATYDLQLAGFENE